MKIIILLLGIAITVIGIIYSKSYHEKNFTKSYASSSSTSSINDSIILGALYFLIGFLLSISPWYIVKSLLIGVGIFFLSLSLFYM